MKLEIKFRDAEDAADVLGMQRPDVEITLSGVPRPDSFVKLNEALTRDARFGAGMTMLLDLTALDTADLSDADVQQLSATVVERDWSYMPSAVAIIAPTERTYNVAVAYRAHLGGSRSRREVFKSRAEAVAWLEEQPES